MSEKLPWICLNCLLWLPPLNACILPSMWMRCMCCSLILSPQQMLYGYGWIKLVDVYAVYMLSYSYAYAPNIGPWSISFFLYFPLYVSPLRTWSILAGTGCHKHVHHSTSSSCIQGSPTKWKQNATKKQKQNEKKSQDIQFPPYPGQPVVRPVCALILGRGPIWGQGYATLPSSTPVWLKTPSPSPLHSRPLHENSKTNPSSSLHENSNMNSSSSLPTFSFCQ